MDIIVVNTSGTEFAQIEKYLSHVSKARRAAVLKKGSDNDKVQSLVAALLVRLELSERLGIPQNKLVFEKGTHGKPYVKGSDMQFSLSHTNGAVCAAFSDSGEIGVDIEMKDRRVSEKLKQRTLSEREREIVQTDEDFIRIWVKKEAFLKRTGIGLATQLCGADTTIISDIAAFDCGRYFVGAAGKNANDAEIKTLDLSELLARL